MLSFTYVKYKRYLLHLSSTNLPKQSQHARYFTAVNTFIDWLNSELDQRGWSRAVLAKKSGVSQSTLSLIYSEQRDPGTETCRAIAGAFNYPPDFVFRKAGLLPELEDPQPPGIAELQGIYRAASDDQRREILDFARFKTRSK